MVRNRSRSFRQKYRWQVTPKHAYTLDPTKSVRADPCIRTGISACELNEVGVGFFSAARIWRGKGGGGLAIKSPLALFFKSEYQLVHTNSALYTRISLQGLSELRRLWLSVP